MPVTRVEVDGGVCGYGTVIGVQRLSPRDINVTLDSGCRMVSECAEALQCIPWKAALDPRQSDSLHNRMFRHIRHTGCPVVAAVAKAIEVEIGAALPADAHILFVDDSLREGGERPAEPGSKQDATKDNHVTGTVP